MAYEYALEKDDNHYPTWFLLWRIIPEDAIKYDDVAWVRIAKFYGGARAEQTLKQLQASQ